MHTWMNDKERVHQRRLFIFKYRLDKLIQEKKMTLEELGEIINDKFLDDVQFEDSYFEHYALSEPVPKEPNLLVALGIARALGVNLNYLFGLDWGELIYSSPRTVGSLLTNAFRALTIEGVDVHSNYASGETIISPTNKYFQHFFERVDLEDDLEANFPILFEIILDSMQDAANIRIDSDDLLSHIHANETLGVSELKYDSEVYIPIAWEMILDTLPMELRPKLDRENQYPTIELTEKKQKVLDALSGNLQKSIGKEDIPTVEWVKRMPVSGATIRKYLNKESIPNINTFIDICYALDVRLEYLLGLDKDPGRLPSFHTMESRFLNLFKILKYANFKIKDRSDHLKVAVSTNPYIYQFFDRKLEMKSLNDAYRIISDEIDSENLCVFRGEILPYDKRIKTNSLKQIQFILKNSSINGNVQDMIIFPKAVRNPSTKYRTKSVPIDHSASGAPSLEEK